MLPVAEKLMPKWQKRPHRVTGWLLMGVFMTMPVAAEIHRWEDEDGNVHFTDKPPAEERNNAQQVDPVEINTSDPMEVRETKEPQAVAIQSTEKGHFATRGEINGYRVKFLIDTGASRVVIPEALANRIGLPTRGPTHISTASGTAEVQNTRLSSVSIKGVQVGDVEGWINPNVDHEWVLLGMSFLRRVDFNQMNDQLILRQRPSQ